MIHRGAAAVLRRSPALTIALAVSLVSATASAAEFAPQFLAIRGTGRIAPVGAKLSQPVYNLTGWKRADGSVVRDVFDIGETITGGSE